MPFPQLHDRSHKSILIVEDDPSIREALRLILDLEGYCIYTAASAEEAIETLERLNSAHKPCLVLTDLMMPGMSGADLERYVKNHNTLVSIPIAIMTASERDLPDSTVIRKPFSVDAIIRLAHEACAKICSNNKTPTPH